LNKETNILILFSLVFSHLCYSQMRILKKTISVFIAALILCTSVGISYSRHFCTAKKFSVCEKGDSCCKKNHTSGIQSAQCCFVKIYYLKANFVSFGEENSNKFFAMHPCLFSVVFFRNDQQKVNKEKRCNPPPLIKDSRTILLSSSKLSV